MNYYVKTEQHENLHIGKSAIGWQFIFRSYPEFNLTSFKEWCNLLKQKDADIVNEYGEKITFNKLLGEISVRGKEFMCLTRIVHRKPKTQKEKDYLIRNQRENTSQELLDCHYRDDLGCSFCTNWFN